MPPGNEENFITEWKRGQFYLLHKAPVGFVRQALFLPLSVFFTLSFLQAASV
jgi:hypothetical protein